MLTKVKTAMLSGIEGSVVTVETDIRRGMPLLTVVGLADVTIREATKRIGPAILNSGYSFPNERVTVNLVPAGKRKEGSHFDLPIAIGITALEKGISEFNDVAFLGELSLDGRVNPIKGALPLAMSLRAAGIKRIVLPADNACEAAVLRDVDILPVNNFGEAVAYAFGECDIAPYRADARRECGADADESVDFSQVAGQEAVKRAVMIGAAGKHGIMMMGSPGCGKTMIAKRIPTIMPELTYEEKLEITGIYSVAGLLGKCDVIIGKRPFRSPHHTITAAALIGGGRRPRPGEISLAHRGVLFLDELGEFDSRVIDAMRQPVEDGFVMINRELDEVIFPSRVMLVAAANPCKCGNLWDERKVCTCSSRQLDSYMRKLSGPFADRIDMHIRMSPVSKEDIMDLGKRGASMSSSCMRAMVKKAVSRQQERYAGTEFDSNASLDEGGLKAYCPLKEGGRRLMSEAYDTLGLSMRAYSRLLKVSRTIADIEGEEEIREEHVAEALMYRVRNLCGHSGEIRSI